MHSVVGQQFVLHVLPIVINQKGTIYNAGDTGDVGSIPGLGKFPGGGNGNPFQYSYLENAMDKRSLVGYKSMGLQRIRHD